MAAVNNVSSDLVWEITRSQNSYLVKRKLAGGVQLSRDPLNVTNKQSRKYSGFSNTKAVGVEAGEKGGVKLTTKKAKNTNTPAAAVNVVTFGPTTSNRKTYKGISAYVAKNGYRPDVLKETLGRASAILASQRPQKEAPAEKLRGAKAKKAAEKESA